MSFNILLNKKGWHKMKKESWLFSWGYGHLFPNHFVEIEGNYIEARDKMVLHFGSAWAFQYPENQRGRLVGHNMKEITLREAIERALPTKMSETLLTKMTSHIATSFWGGDQKGTCLQITSSKPVRIRGCVIEQLQEEGFIQLTLGEAKALMETLKIFIEGNT